MLIDETTTPSTTKSLTTQSTTKLTPTPTGKQCLYVLFAVLIGMVSCVIYLIPHLTIYILYMASFRTVHAKVASQTLTGLNLTSIA